jgi:eukaryotic-like serine/threonine-protein kinase
LSTEEPAGNIGPYRLARKIGRGSMGTVYEGLDANGRRLAIKVLTGELAVHEELVERFRREAMAAANFQHPNITSVVDFGEEGDNLYMVMELLEGADLKELIERGELGPFPERLRIMTQVAAGMALVHAGNLVHRDLKPGNIHVTPDGVAKIMDFGIVRLGDSNMTATGMVMGSPAYMAPEQLRGARVDASSDVFALGVTFYELLSGRRAFGGKGLADVMMKVLSLEPTPLAACAPETPPAVAMVIARCLRKDPGGRYRNAGELHAALEALEAVYGAT